MERVVLLAHGAGSSPDVVRRLLAPCLPRGVRVVAPDLRGDLDDAAAQLAALVAAHEVVLSGGISLGAHALVVVAAARGTAFPLVLAMPAWTGAPGPVASATAAAADEVARLGKDRVLADLAADPATRDDWVLEELVAGWSAYDDRSLVAALRAASGSRGPTLEELEAVRAPAVVVALDHDPLHPLEVAEEWAAHVLGARLRVVGRRAPDDDRGALGRAAALAFADVSGSR